MNYKTNSIRIYEIGFICIIEMYSIHTEIKFTLKSKTIMATETNIKKKNSQ